MDTAQRASFLRGLGNETRLSIVDLLGQHQELNVTELTALLHLPQSTVSKHLGEMRARSIVGVRTTGVQRFYHLQEENFVELRRYISDVQLNLGGGHARPV